jgi:phosphatidylglycerophosphate synthase
MKNPFFHTVSEIKRQYVAHKYREELSGEWGSVLLYRWISFFLGALFTHYGVSANAVTLITVILSLLLPVVLLLPPDVAFIFLAAGSIIIAILDCTDGNIARITNTVSSKGQYLDFIADVFYRISLYTTLGFIIQYSNSGWILITGHAAFFCLLAAMLAVTARLCRIYSESRFTDGQPELSGQIQATPGRNIKPVIFSFISGLDHLLPIFILLAGIYGMLVWVMIWILVYSMLDFIYTQWNIIRRLP